MSYSEFFVNPFYPVTLNNASDYRTMGYIVLSGNGFSD